MARIAAVFVSVVFLCGCATTADATPDPLLAALNHARARVHAPEATAAVVRDGQVVWQGGSGTRRRGARLRVTAGTPSILASSTKTVVATMIMQLVQDGQLSLEQPLSDFYPALPNAGAITLRMLLNHTSGLADYDADPRISNLMDNAPRHAWTRDEVLAGVHAPQFPPGSRYRYTNTNYVVLAGILEKVTGQSIEQRFQERIAGPAGMTASTFAYEPQRSRSFAHPYWTDDAGVINDNWVAGLGIASDYWGPVWGDGGLASTAPDLARFGDALFAGKLVSSQTLNAMLSFSGPDDYGLGIYEKEVDGVRWIGHDGDYGGYESENWHDPATNVTITVTTDLEEPSDASDTNSDRIWLAIERAYAATG
jgi:D-alanyl-D-alanine carboxypeptidase